jgi:hypothetical protein
MGMKEDTVRNIGFTRLAISPRHHRWQRSYPKPGFVGWEASCLGGLAILISGFPVAQSQQR